MIPSIRYEKIVKDVPILCVDLVVTCVKSKKYLLVNRINEPLSGQFWVPGGRVLIGEKITDALSRKLFEETGLRIESSFEFLGFYEGMFDRSAFGRHKYHTVSLVYKCTIEESQNIILDSQSTDFIWSDSLPVQFSINGRI